MDTQVLGPALGFVGGVLSTVITTWAIFYARRLNDRALESDEIRRRKVQVIFQLLGSRYVLLADYSASSEEVQVFNTAMALFSVYFTEPQVKEAYDRFITNKTDDNLFDMLKVAAKTANVDLLPSNLMRVMVVKPRNFVLKAEAVYTGAPKPNELK